MGSRWLRMHTAWSLRIWPVHTVDTLGGIIAPTVYRASLIKLTGHAAGDPSGGSTQHERPRLCENSRRSARSAKNRPYMRSVAQLGERLLRCPKRTRRETSRGGVFTQPRPIAAVHWPAGLLRCGPTKQTLVNLGKTSEIGPIPKIPPCDRLPLILSYALAVDKGLFPLGRLGPFQGITGACDP